MEKTLNYPPLEELKTLRRKRSEHGLGKSVSGVMSTSTNCVINKRRLSLTSGLSKRWNVTVLSA